MYPTLKAPVSGKIPLSALHSSRSNANSRVMVKKKKKANELESIPKNVDEVQRTYRYKL